MALHACCTGPSGQRPYRTGPGRCEDDGSLATASRARAGLAPRCWVLMNTTTLTDPRADLVAAWLGGRVIRTQQAYRQALAHYAAWAGTDPAAAVVLIFDSH